MPLGDPHGGDFIYINEGLPHGIAAAIIPCRDVKRALMFYVGLLKMELIKESTESAIVKNYDEYLILKRSQDVGKDTGICLRLDSPYDTHRRLVDEGVVFVLDPKKTELGLMTSFKDWDGNIIYGIEVQI